MAIQDGNLSGTEQGAVAGLFSDCEKGERAISELKKQGFSNDQIGAARSDYANSDMTVAEVEDRDSHFWNRIQGIFSSGEDLTAEYSHPADFESSLGRCGVSGDRARYFAPRIHGGGCLVTVKAPSDRKSEAVAILEKNGADMGTGAATVQAATPTAGAGRRVHLLGHLLKAHKEGTLGSENLKPTAKDRRVA
jgi:hypothetical protein